MVSSKSFATIPALAAALLEVTPVHRTPCGDSCASRLAVSAVTVSHTSPTGLLEAIGYLGGKRRMFSAVGKP
jgi:hypothetical protein